MQIVKPLTDGEVEKINEASEGILGNVGLSVEHDELLIRFKNCKKVLNCSSL